MIKKILLGMTLLMSMVSCTEDYTDWANPQTNPQEDAVAFGNGSVTPVDVINLADVKTEKVKVASIVAPTSSNAAYTPTYKINIGGRAFDIDAEGNMAKADLVNYIVDKFGKRPTEHDIDATLDAWVSNGVTAVKMATSEKFQIKAIPEAPVIDEGYYLVGDMFTTEDGVNGWNTISDKQTFKHSDKDVYEDPIFTITFETTKADQYWKIIPKANVDAGNTDASAAGVVGPKVDGEDSMTGSLTNGDAKAGKIAKAGKYKLTLNMMDYSYTIEEAPELYMKGDANGWDGYDYLAGDGVHFTGFMYLNQNGFKFTTAPDWSGTGYGENFSTAPDAGNIVMTEPAGYYKVDVDLSAKTYTLTPITSIGIIGSAAPNGWDSDVDLTYVPYNKETKEGRYWEAKNIKLKAGECKFRANDAWDMQWGFDGDKFVFSNNAPQKQFVPEAGTYDIKLYAWANGYAKCEFTKK
ncbi:MAG TPA: hypothetical protein DCX05_11450 [Prevotella sp.]|nr:hypothetical protein [Prevotella sp.]